MAISQILVSILRNRIEGYNIEKIRLAFHDTEIVLITHHFLNLVLLVSCGVLLLVNTIGYYNKSLEDPDQAKMDA
jgi:hypothetical protein